MAILKQKIGPAEATLFYDDILLATISIYGVRTNVVSWMVMSDETFSCSKLETERSHLKVKANGKIIPVEMYQCLSR